MTFGRTRVIAPFVATHQCPRCMTQIPITVALCYFHSHVWAPMCMDAAEWALWQQANNQLNVPADRPCRDCPRSFFEEMYAKDRCNGSRTPNSHRVVVPTGNDRLDRRRATWRKSAARKKARAGSGSISTERTFGSEPGGTR